jgi:DNA sulfur modification protein DndC
MQLLKQICGEDKIHYQLVRGLISQSQKYRTMARRSGLFDTLEQVITRHFYEDEEDAEDRARSFKDKRQEIRKKIDLFQCAPYVRQTEDKAKQEQ